jgi:hypothetical protein
MRKRIGTGKKICKVAGGLLPGKEGSWEVKKKVAGTNAARSVMICSRLEIFCFT